MCISLWGVIVRSGSGKRCHCKVTCGDLDLESVKFDPTIFKSNHLPGLLVGYTAIDQWAWLSLWYVLSIYKHTYVKHHVRKAVSIQSKRRFLSFGSQSDHETFNEIEVMCGRGLPRITKLKCSRRFARGMTFPPSCYPTSVCAAEGQWHGCTPWTAEWWPLVPSTVKVPWD